MSRQCPAGPSCWMLDAADTEEQPAERLDITGRDLYGLPELDMLAAAYPAVHALMQELAAAEAAMQRVRELHEREVIGKPPIELAQCTACTDENLMPWPCPTITALDRPDDEP